MINNLNPIELSSSSDSSSLSNANNLNNLNNSSQLDASSSQSSVITLNDDDEEEENTSSNNSNSSNNVSSSDSGNDDESNENSSENESEENNEENAIEQEEEEEDDEEESQTSNKSSSILSNNITNSNFSFSIKSNPFTALTFASQSNTKLSLFNCANSLNNTHSLGVENKNDFEFSEPFKLERFESLDKIRLLISSKTKRLLSSYGLYEYEIPRKLDKKLKTALDKNEKTESTSERLNLSIEKIECDQAVAEPKQQQQQQQQQPPKHKVVVDQAPFSVYKSVKMVDQIDKSSLIVVNSMRNHPYNNSIRPIESQNALASSKPDAELNNSNDSFKSPSLMPRYFPNSSSATSSITITKLSNNNNNNNNNNKNSFGETDKTKEKPATIEHIISKSAITSPMTHETLTNKKSENTDNKPTRNSSSNAILAQLQSIGPTFKSIFIRPKNIKHIDASEFYKQKKTSTTKLAESKKTILSMLYNTSNNLSSKSRPDLQEQQQESKYLMKIIPNIQPPSELRLNQSVDEVLRKFAHENMVLNKTIKHIGASSIRSHSPASSTRSVSPSSSMKRAEIPLKFKSDKLEKWTCMVCLSKHPLRVDICSICGSNRPEQSQLHTLQHPSLPTTASHSPQSTSTSTSLTVNFAKPVSSTAPNTSTSFSTYLLAELAKTKEKEESISPRSSPSDQEIAHKESSPNPYLKKWTCAHCNFSNDSLKIVCLNCRWVKSSTTNQKNAMKLLNETSILPFKSPRRESLSEQNDESPLNKKNKTKNQETSLCQSCKTSLTSEPCPAADELLASTENAAQIKPLLFSDQKPSSSSSLSSSSQQKVVISDLPSSTSAPVPLADIFKTSSSTSGSKWTCSTCLVQNADNLEKCSCCAASKPNSVAKSQTVPLLSSAFSNAASTKWTCSACLVNNDADKLKCVCCQADKPGAKNKIEKETSSISASVSFGTSSSLSLSGASSATTSGFKFGIQDTKTLASNEPIKFGSTSNFLSVFANSNKNDEEKSDKSAASSLFKVPTLAASVSADAASKEKDTVSFFKLPTTFDSKDKETSLADDKKASLSFKPLATTTTTPSSSSETKETPSTVKTTATLPTFSFGSLSSKSDGTTNQTATATSTPFKFGEIYAASSSANAISTPLLGGLTSSTAFPSPFPGLTGLTATKTETKTTSTAPPVELSKPFFSLFGTPIKSTETQSNVSSAASSTTSLLDTKSSLKEASSLAQGSSFNLFGKPAAQETKPSEASASKPAPVTTSAQPSLFKFGQTENKTSSVAQPSETISLLSANTTTTPSSLSFFNKETVNTPPNTTLAASSNSQQTPSLFGASKTNFFGSDSTVSFGGMSSGSGLSSKSSEIKPLDSATSSSLFGKPQPSIDTQQQPVSKLSFSFQSPANTTQTASASANTFGATITPSVSTNATPSFQSGFLNTTPSALITPTSSQQTASAFGSAGSLFSTNQASNISTFTFGALNNTASQTPTANTSFFGSSSGANATVNAPLCGNTNSAGFKFDSTPPMNFNFGVANTPQPGGIIQFSGNSDTSAGASATDLSGRKFRKAARKIK